MISMLAGKPNSGTFPVTSLQFTARDPLLPDPANDLKIELNAQDVEDALQYGPSRGLPGILEWTFGLQEREHNRKKEEGWRISIGAGSQDLLNKVRGAECSERVCAIREVG